MNRSNLIKAAVTAAMLAAAPVVADTDTLSGRESPATGAEVRDQPEQYERQPSGMPVVPGAEPIQPRAVQPGQSQQRARAADPDTAAEDRRWVHEVRGRVVTVDRTSGVVSLAPDVGEPLVMQFTPESVAGVAAGEQIVTRSTYMRDQFAPGAKEPVPPPSKPELQAQTGQRMVSGIVSDLDRSTGRVDLKTDQTMLKLQFPPQVVESLHDGERIIVDMGFSKVDQPTNRG